MVDSSDPSRLLEVGRVDRGHGLKGEVLVTLTTTMVGERTAPGARLNVDGTWMTVKSSRPHQKKWLLALDSVHDRNEADQLRGSTISAVPIESSDQVFVHELIGKTLIDQHGQTHDEIVSVVENPASDLMELSSGLLVPLAFYQRHDEHTVEVDVPAGLLDGNPIE